LVILEFPQPEDSPDHHIGASNEVSDDQIASATFLAGKLKENEAADPVEGLNSLVVGLHGKIVITIEFWHDSPETFAAI